MKIHSKKHKVIEVDGNILDTKELMEKDMGGAVDYLKPFIDRAYLHMSSIRERDEVLFISLFTANLPLIHAIGKVVFRDLVVVEYQNHSIWMHKGATPRVAKLIQNTIDTILAVFGPQIFIIKKAETKIIQAVTTVILSDIFLRTDITSVDELYVTLVATHQFVIDLVKSNIIMVPFRPDSMLEGFGFGG